VDEHPPFSPSNIYWRREFLSSNPAGLDEGYLSLIRMDIIAKYRLLRYMARSSLDPGQKSFIGEEPCQTRNLSRHRRDGHQGGAVVRALRASGEFKSRALTRNPAKHPHLADEVVLADLNRPETLKSAFAGAHGVFLVTNAWEPGTDEQAQALAVVRAAKDAGVTHFIWSTLPNVETISSGKLHVPHFTDKAKIERIVADAGFAHHTFVIAPFFYQNLVGAMAPQKHADGTSLGASARSTKRVIHMGDISELVPSWPVLSRSRS